MGWLFTLIPVVILLGSVLISGVYFVKFFDQRRYDRDRKTYILKFPADLQHRDVARWLRYTSRTVRTGGSLLGSQTVVFEMLATDEGITHRLLVPWQHDKDIIQQLRTMVPGAAAQEDNEFKRFNWTAAVEAGARHPARMLDIPEPNDLAASLLGAAQPLKEGEGLLLQWVVTPAPREPLPAKGARSNAFTIKGVTFNREGSSDEISDRRTKLSEPNMLAVVRIAAHSNTQKRADSLIGQLKSKLDVVATPPNYWVKRRGTKRGIISRTSTAASLTIWPAQLNVSELSGVIAWPIGSPNVSGLPRGASRQVAANMAVPKTGIVIGVSTFPGNERPIALSYLGSHQHTHIIGGTGSGKTTLMANMAQQDMEAGHTVIVMESKGDLFYETLARVPRERIDDVIVVDLQDTAFPVGFNILQQGNPRVAVGNLKNLFEHQFSDLRTGIFARSALHRGLETLISDPSSAFVDIVPLFSPSGRGDDEEEWRDRLIAGVDDHDVRRFWQRFNDQKKDDQERYAQPLTNRAWIINETPEVRNVFGQSTSSFTFDEVFTQNKIVLINLAGVPDDAASLTGTLFMQSMWTSIQTLRGTADKDALLYLDEFQSFLKLPIGADEMLAKARSFRLGMRLAHQHLDQLKSTPELASAVVNNARNKIVYQTGSDDAAKMAREFSSNLVSASDFQNLRQYEAYARVVTDDGVSAPLSVRTLPPTKRTANVEHIRNLSRQKYGRPRDQVVQDMRNRRRASDEGKSQRRSRPKISGDDW